LSVPSTRAGIIPIGEVTFTGDFTINHLYDFNNPGAQPFGWFGTQTVKAATGVFARFVHHGDVLGGAGELWSDGPLPLFTIGGFNLDSFFVLITGPDSGRFVFGDVNFSGNGYPNRDIVVNWSFVAPCYDISNFPEDITGPITFRILALPRETQ
jgi:hypothetical protein